MKAIFQCYKKPTDALEINILMHTVSLTIKPSDGEETYIFLNKKDIVELIQVLSGCLLKLE